MEPLFFLILAIVSAGLIIYGFLKKSALPAFIGLLLLIILSYLVFYEGISVKTITVIHRDDMNNITSITEQPDPSQAINAQNSSAVRYLSILGIFGGVIIFFYVFLSLFVFKK